MRLADAHTHLFHSGYSGRYGRPSSGGDDVDIYQSLMREHRIGLALLVGYEGDSRYRGNNAYLANLAGDHKWIAPLAYTPVAKPKVPGTPFLGVAVYIPSVADAVAFSSWPEHVIAELAKPGQVFGTRVCHAAFALDALDQNRGGGG